MLGEIQPTDFICIPLNGEPTDNGQKPSKELPLHRGVYLTRPDLRAVLHLHPVNSIAVSLLLASTEEDVPVYTPGFLVKVGRFPQVGEYRSGSNELAEHTAALFAKANCVLMRRHGIVAGAKTIQNAFTRAEDIEQNASLHLLLRGHGAMSAEEVRAVLSRTKAQGDQ